MKLVKTSESFHETFPFVRVHLDDIEQLSEVIRTAGFTVHYSDELYEYDSVEELASKRGIHPRVLHLTATGPNMPVDRLSISFKGGTAVLHALWPDNIGELRYKLPQILKARVSRLGRVFNYQFWLFAFVASVVLTTIWQQTPSIRSLVPVILTGGLAAVSYALNRGLTGVWLKRRHEGGFFTRNSDKLWLLFIGGVIGAVFGYLGGLLAK